MLTASVAKLRASILAVCAVWGHSALAQERTGTAPDPSVMSPHFTHWLDTGVPGVLVRYGCAGANAFRDDGNQWFVELENRTDQNLRVDYAPYIYANTQPQMISQYEVI